MANSALTIASAELLTSAALSAADLLTQLTAASSGSDFADLFLQTSYGESWVLEEGIVKDSSFGIDRGFGARVVNGEQSGFAFSNEISAAAIGDALAKARMISSVGSGEVAVPKLQTITGHSLYSPNNPLQSLTADEKVELLHRLDQEARAQDSRVKQVTASLSGAYELVLILNSAGTVAADVRPLVRLNVTVVAEERGSYERASAGGGARSGYQWLLEKERALGYARDAVRVALLNLHAIEAPAGLMPVVLAAGWPGVLLHEAIGHGLEGDAIRKGSSIFSGRMGSRVASPLCTIVDNGSLEGARRGSLNIDDEGSITQNTTLIRGGILEGIMLDRLNARLLGKETTGNGRRESYAHIPLPRMTNTYLLPGTSKPKEIIESVARGIYAVNFRGGEVDVTSGKFVFTSSEAYLIEKGRVTKPIKGATLIGDGLTALQKITMVGNDLELDPGIGVCGKGGQGVPVGIGQPTVKLSELTVGGTFA